MDTWRAIRTLAAEQGGVVTRIQLLAAGLSDSTVVRYVGKGLLDPLIPGVFTLPGAFLDDRTLLRAACLGLRGAVVSHQSAASLHGFDGIRGARPVVVVPHGRTHRFPGVTVRESKDLSADQVTRVDGIPTTSPPRTIIDLAAVLPAKQVDWIVEGCLVARQVTLEELASLLGQLARRGKPGVANLRSLLVARGPGYVVAPSVAESRAMAVLLEAGLPAPEGQYRPEWLEYIEGCVDLAYPWARLIVEIDGRRWHSRDKDFERDRLRDNLAQLAGWRILRFTWRQLTANPAMVVAMVRQALATKWGSN